METTLIVLRGGSHNGQVLLWDRPTLYMPVLPARAAGLDVSGLSSVALPTSETYERSWPRRHELIADLSGVEIPTNGFVSTNDIPQRAAEVFDRRP